MKAKCLLLVSVLAGFFSVSCSKSGPTCFVPLELTWYMPYTDGEILDFVSDSGDTVSLEAEPHSMLYEADYGSACDDFMYSVGLKCPPSSYNILLSVGGIDSRSEGGPWSGKVSLCVSLPEVGQGCFGRVIQYDYNGRIVGASIPDTIVLSAYYGTITLVKCIGISEFHYRGNTGAGIVDKTYTLVRD